MSDQPQEEWVTKTRMAALLGMSRPTLYKLIKDGILIVHKISGKMPRFENERIWNQFKTKSIVQVAA